MFKSIVTNSVLVVFIFHRTKSVEPIDLADFNLQKRNNKNINISIETLFMLNMNNNNGIGMNACIK